MRRKISLGIASFFFIVLAVACGVTLGQLGTYYFAIWSLGSVETISVETREVPVEETVVVPIDVDSLSSSEDTVSIEIGGVGSESVIVNLTEGIWLAVGASEESPVVAISLDHPAATSWNSAREVLVVSDKYRYEQLRDENPSFSTLPLGGTRFSVDTDGAWRISFFKVPYPSE